VYRWYGLDEVPAWWGESVVTIGAFDGVHRGHQRIVERAAEAGRERRLPVVVITFDPHPDEVIRPGSHPPFLCSARRQAELLAGLGTDAVLVLPFTLEFSRLDPDEFVRTVLVERLHAALVVVGEDFRFGHKAAGDVQLLAKLGEKYEFTTEGMPLVADGVTISSTSIRGMLERGDAAAAAKALGRPHRVEGVVVRGHQRGRALGFPTANLETPPHTATPADGIYAGWLASLDDEGRDLHRWPAAISIGANPTFGAGGERTVEAYALDRTDLDLYGMHAAIDFAARLRGTLRFNSVDALVQQMRRDVDQARELTR
jgi:riboflavin kinase / FMN adenylyltransferase